VSSAAGTTRIGVRTSNDRSAVVLFVEDDGSIVYYAAYAPEVALQIAAHITEVAASVAGVEIKENLQ
jgi:hypothetical protein